METPFLVPFDRLPFIRTDDAYYRTLCTLWFYAESEWQIWLQVEEGFLRAKGAWPGEGFYWGDKKADPNDMYFGFWDFLAQRGNISGIRQQINGLQDDFLNLSASTAKIDFLFFNRANPEFNQGLWRMVATEIEYIISVCRSIFDILQEYIARLWQSVKITSSGIKKKELPPRSFAKIALKDEDIIDAATLQDKYGLPSQLAEFYARNAKFVRTLRSIRNSLTHDGSSIPSIFDTEKGFAIRDTYEAFAQFGVWKDEDNQPNGLASIRPIIGYIIQQTLGVCEDFGRVMQSTNIQFFDPMVPGFQLYLRGPTLANLRKTIDSLDGDPWWPEKKIPISSDLSIR